MLQAGEEVVHPQWGRGTVLFDKPHCIGIRFIEHGQVNFSQEEWDRQESPPERFRGIASKGLSALSELEYTLQEAVENLELTEEEALRMLRQRVHPLEVRRRKRPNLLKAFEDFRSQPDNKALEDDFYTALLNYITALVKRSCHDQATFSNIEDSIQESAIEVWQRLEEFTPSRSPLTSWVGLITMHNVRDALRRFRTSHGHPQRPEDDESPRVVTLDEEVLASKNLALDDQFAIKEFADALTPLDRSILQMSSDGLTLREVGEALNMSHVAIRKRLKKLKTRFTSA